MIYITGDVKETREYIMIYITGDVKETREYIMIYITGQCQGDTWIYYDLYNWCMSRRHVNIL